MPFCVSDLCPLSLVCAPAGLETSPVLQTWAGMQSTSRAEFDHTKFKDIFGDKPMGPRQRRALEAMQREAS